MMMTTMQKKMKLLHGRSEQPCGLEHDKNNFHWSTKKYILFNWSSKYEKNHRINPVSCINWFAIYSISGSASEETK